MFLFFFIINDSFEFELSTRTLHIWEKKREIKNKGITRLGSYGQGDQILHVHVETPTKLSAEQKEIFEKLGEMEHQNSNPMAKGFFDKVRDLFQ